MKNKTIKAIAHLDEIIREEVNKINERLVELNYKRQDISEEIAELIEARDLLKGTRSGLDCLDVTLNKE